MKPLTFGSFCSGIEAATEAWAPLGWTCGYVAEVEPFPCHYLHQRHGASRPRYMPRPEEAKDLAEKRSRAQAIRKVSELPAEAPLINFGDVSQIRPGELPAVDIIAAGFPCQDFSIAGLRSSLSGNRGSLSIIGMRLILEAADLGLVRGALLEQVPDVLNTADNAWGNILGALVGADAALEGLDHGGKWPRAGMVAGPRSRVAWRILDAQHFGLAQRRERVWAVVDFGDGPDPAAVLFERKGVPGDFAAGGETREGVAGAADGGPALGRDDRPQRRSAPDIAPTRTREYAEQTGQDAANGLLVTEVSADLAPSLRAQAQAQASHRPDSEVYVAHSLRAEGFDASEDGIGRGTPLVPVAYSIMPQNSGKDYKAREVDVAQPLMASGPVGGDQGGDQGGDYIVQPIAFNARQDSIIYPDQTGPLDTDGFTHAIAFSCKDSGADAGDLAPTMRAMSHSGSHANAGGQVAVAFSLRGREGGTMPEIEGDDVSPALRAAEGGSTRPFVAFDETQITSKANRSNPKPGDPCHPLSAHARPPTLASTWAVRRITVVEAETLQGFPPNATLIRWPSANRKGDDLSETIAYLIGHGFTSEEAAEFAQTPDGPRYRAIGNSWPVPVAAWIGRRIAEAAA